MFEFYITFRFINILALISHFYVHLDSFFVFFYNPFKFFFFRKFTFASIHIIGFVCVFVCVYLFFLHFTYTFEYLCYRLSLYHFRLDLIAIIIKRETDIHLIDSTKFVYIELLLHYVGTFNIWIFYFGVRTHFKTKRQFTYIPLMNSQTIHIIHRNCRQK